jgi:hypothetical protein
LDENHCYLSEAKSDSIYQAIIQMHKHNEKNIDDLITMFEGFFHQMIGIKQSRDRYDESHKRVDHKNFPYVFVT